MTANSKTARALITGLCALLFCPLLLASAATVEGYAFPITDRFVATVVGTPVEHKAQLPESPFKQRQITIFPERETPDVFFYGEELLYSVALQKEKAPLIFLIAGTGASHNGGKNHNMANAFHHAGFHVVSISSPTFNNFVIAASSTGVVGHAEKDAEDIYRVFERIWDELQEDIEVSAFHVTGYSLGGFNAAYVAKLDEERQVFKFEHVLLINPPVSIYNSISLLDRMIDNIPGGVDNFDAFVNDLLRAYTETYQESTDAVGDDFLYKAYQALDMKDEQLAALIGTSFRISSASLVFTSDVVSDFGYIKPRGLELDRYSDLGVYNQVASRLGFTDYYHEFFYPYYQAENPGVSRDEYIASISLEEISDYLKSAEKITVMHNADDVILEPGEINFFTEVFGDRATIYPVGGHCGNMDYTENVAHMIAAFTGENAQ